jgi:Mce-associated membrane protein
VRSRLFAILLVLVAVLLGVSATRMYLDLRRLQGSEEAAAEAVVAARSYAADMLSYDYRSIAKDLSRGQEHATGALVGRYRRSVASLEPEAKRQQIVQQAIVAAAGVESATPDEVRVVVLLNIVTSRREAGDDLPRQQVGQNRARLVLVRSDDGWLVSDLSTLLGNTPMR